MNGSFPYQPIADAISAHVRTCSPEQLRRMLGKSAIDLAKITPELRAKLPDLPQPESLGPEAERRNLYNAVATYFNTLAAEHPLAIILDDIQWVDTATMQLLTYLTGLSSAPSHSGKAAPFYLLLYRAEEVHETHPLRSLFVSLTRMGSAEEVRLKRLKEEAVQQL